MIPPDDDHRTPAARRRGSRPDDETTGLPWLRELGRRLAAVFGCFVTYVVLLVVLKQAFS